MQNIWTKKFAVLVNTLNKPKLHCTTSELSLFKNDTKHITIFVATISAVVESFIAKLHKAAIQATISCFDLLNTYGFKDGFPKSRPRRVNLSPPPVVVVAGSTHCTYGRR